MDKKTHAKGQNATLKPSETTPVKVRRTITDDGDLAFDPVGQSKFSLQNNQYYRVRPNLAPYYEPLKPTLLQKLLIRNKKITSFMCKLTEFDQDMTSLIMTNNPLPSISQDSGQKYFSKMILQEICYQPKPTEKVSLPQMPQKKKTTFPMKRMDDPTFKQKQWFRFSTDKDFESEGKYSKVYTLRKQKKMYPQLIFAPGYGEDKKKGVSEQPVSQEPRSEELWEPLTFSTLVEQKPTRNAPGESTFRYGRAKQWIIKKATTTRR